jgi:IS5 family transposase
MAEAAQAAAGGPAQSINVVADAGYSNGEQAEACEAKGILPHVPANRGVNNHGDGTLFDRSEFTYQPLERYVAVPGRADSHSQTTIAERSCRALCGTTRSLRRMPSAIALHRVAATDDYSSPARRGATAHATAGHAGGYATATINRGTSIRQSEIPIFGHPRFLLRGLRGAQTEISLAVAAYNLKRMLNILGDSRYMQSCKPPDLAPTSHRATTT